MDGGRRRRVLRAERHEEVALVLRQQGVTLAILTSAATAGAVLLLAALSECGEAHTPKGLTLGERLAVATSLSAKAAAGGGRGNVGAQASGGANAGQLAEARSDESTKLL